MVRILHTADWQIGKQFGQFEPDDAALLAEARFEVVERLAALANEHHVDLVLVAGDVFDTQGVADKTIHRLFHSMKPFSGDWILIPGNHDAGLSESVWTRAFYLKAVPPNVHVCLHPEPLMLDTISTVVLPAPLTQRLTHADLTEWFASAETPDGFYRIGIAHGSVQGLLAEDIDATNPIASDRAAQAHLSYLGLGDWHGTKQVDDRTWYSGTPETDRFKANDSGQALLVELEAPKALPRVTVLSTGKYHWQNLTVSLQVPSDIDQLLEQLSRLGASDVTQITISGQTDLAGHRRIKEAIGQAQGRVRSLIANLGELRLEPTADDIAALKADGYLGEVISELQACQNGADAEVSREALALLAGILERRTHGEAK